MNLPELGIVSYPVSFRFSRGTTNPENWTDRIDSDCRKGNREEGEE